MLKRRFDAHKTLYMCIKMCIRKNAFVKSIYIIERV
nr:MAG TPA: hypothetical protein [Caudoviricetes sp.]